MGVWVTFAESSRPLGSPLLPAVRQLLWLLASLLRILRSHSPPKDSPCSRRGRRRVTAAGWAWTIRTVNMLSLDPGFLLLSPEILRKVEVASTENPLKSLITLIQVRHISLCSSKSLWFWPWKRCFRCMFLALSIFVLQNGIKISRILSFSGFYSSSLVKLVLVLPSTCLEGDKNKVAVRHNYGFPTLQKTVENKGSGTVSNRGPQFYWPTSRHLWPLLACAMRGFNAVWVGLTGTVTIGVIIVSTAI